MSRRLRIPDAGVTRLSLYLRELSRLDREQIQEALAHLASAGAAAVVMAAGRRT